MVAHADPLAPARARAAHVIVWVWDGSGSGQHRLLATSTGRSVMRANGWADGFRGVGGRAAGGFPTAGRGSRLSGSGVLAAVPLIIRSQTGEAFLVIGSQEGRGRPF
jgi:hypothetical protein